MKKLPSIHQPIQRPDGSMEYVWYLFLQWVSENAGAADLSDYFTKEETQALLDVKANVDDLADVAFSGEYDDLKNKPTIPTVNNATLTIQKNGTTVKTFTANASSDVTANITVPTKISDLTNDSNFANTDLSNLTSAGKNIGLWCNNAANIITEIPQDIKLELNNGTLTLKAGSKVYVPNGTGVFDEVVIENDISQSIPAIVRSGSLLTLNPAKTAILPWVPKDCYSGTTAPTSIGTHAVWYDTANNVIKLTNDGGSTWLSGVSLPFGTASSTTTAWTSIDQVFNGFGYIGSIIFALPGVKVLIPDGRNVDGTLKNIATTMSSVSVMTNPDNNRNKIFCLNSGGVIGQGNIWFTSTTQPLFIENNDNFWYNPDTNLVYYYRSSGNVNNGFVQRVLVGYFTTNASARIASFNPRTVFNIVDYSDTDFIAHQAMPSDRYIDLTLGTSPFNFTAPADGYLVFAKNASTAGYEIRLKNQSNLLEVHDAAGKNNQDLAVTIPCSKRDVIRVYFSADGVTSSFRFVYANGAK